MIETQKLREVIEKSDNEGKTELLEDMGFDQNNLDGVQVDPSVSENLIDANVKEPDDEERTIKAKNVKKILGDKYGFFCKEIGGPDKKYQERDVFEFVFQRSRMDLTDMDDIPEELGYDETIGDISKRLNIRIKKPPEEKGGTEEYKEDHIIGKGLDKGTLKDLTKVVSEEEKQRKRLENEQEVKGKKPRKKKKKPETEKTMKDVTENAKSIMESIYKKERFLKEDLRRHGMKESLNLSGEEVEAVMKECFQGKNKDFSLTRIYGLKCALRKFTGDRRLEAFNNLLGTSYSSIEKVKEYMISEYADIANNAKGVFATINKIIEKIDSPSTVDIDYHKCYVENIDAMKRRLGTSRAVYVNKDFINQKLDSGDVSDILGSRLFNKYRKGTFSKKRFRRCSVIEFVMYSDKLSEEDTLDILNVLYGKSFNGLDDAAYHLNGLDLGFMLKIHEIEGIKHTK